MCRRPSFYINVVIVVCIHSIRNMEKCHSESEGGREEDLSYILDGSSGNIISHRLTFTSDDVHQQEQVS